MPVPKTALRRLYEFMGAAASHDFHLALANELCRKPKILLDLVENSWNHFSGYNNPAVGFHNHLPQGEPNPQVLGNDAAAYRLVVALHERRENFQGNLDIAFDYVDYAVCPNRTLNNAVFDDGLAACQGSAMDLLLRCRNSHLPIVGEIKNAAPGEEDKHAFFALIQGLMYSVELLTANQRDRLRAMYIDEEGQPRFVNPTEGPYGDLYIILIGHKAIEGAWRHELLKRADQLAGMLMEPGNAVSNMLRRIVFLNTELVPQEVGEQARFSTLFVQPRPPVA